MEITIIGSGTGIPSRRRCSPCIVVRMGESVLMLDGGPGSLRRMLDNGVAYNDVTSAHYTHTHVDHVNDLAQFLFASKYDENPRVSPLFISGPPGFRGFYERLVNLYGDQVVSDKYELTIEEFSSDERDLDGWKLKTRPMLHMVPCTGYRIEDSGGNSLVYTGDTDYCEGVLELSENADVLIIESALPPGYELEGHLTPEKAGEIAREAGVSTLVLTHLYPVCDLHDIRAEAKKSFEGDILVAEDLLHIDLNRS